MSEAPASESQLSTLLVDNDTDQYYMEYWGYRSNHMPHGLIALHRLGAHYLQLEAFIKHYKRRLENVGGETHTQQIGNDDENIPALLGKRKCFYRLLGHYQELLDNIYSGSFKEMVKREFPGLSLGMSGSALHGLIHTGYGIVAGHPRVVCEGLAYLHFSYCPLSLSANAPDLKSWGQGSVDVLDVMSMVREDQSLREYMLKEWKADWIQKKSIGEFQSRMVALTNGKSDEIAQYVHQIKFPDYYNHLSKSSEQTAAMIKWMVDCGIIIYQIVEKRNDFLLLHGVTGSWALSTILPLLQDYDLTLESIRTMFCILLLVYVAQDSPPLVLEQLTEPDVSALSWPDIRTAVLEMPSDTDEHVYKLVQVCDDISKTNTDTRMSGVYKRAALTAMTCPLVGTTVHKD